MKTHNYKPIFLGAAAIAVVALAFYLLVLEAGNVSEDTCVGVTEIASDAKKMNYVKSWLVSRFSDQEFMNELRRSRFFDKGDPRLHEYIDLDWAYLGLTPDFVSLAFNVRNSGKSDFDASEIASVSIGQNRSTIIIGLNDQEDLGLPWPAEALSKMRPIANDVFVHCGA